jgi:choline dehydrogenase
MVRRVLFEGRRASGVEIENAAGRGQLHARHEVILAAGAIASPQLLELSGIGDGDRLAALGIPVLQHSPGVGESLQDHFSGMLTVRLKAGTPSMNEMSRGFRLWGQVGRYGLARKGMLTATPAQIVALARSRPERDLPDLQFFASPATPDLSESMKSGRTVLSKDPGITISCYQVRPSSRGSVHAHSPDPAIHPKINLNFLSHPADQQTMADGLRMAKRILDQPALAPLCESMTMWDPDGLDDAASVDRIRKTGNTAYHYSGTCRMGSSDAVLTPRLAVRGVDGLRVVDASVMPTIVSGNTNAAVIMIAEKAAIMIKEDARSSR